MATAQIVSSRAIRRTKASDRAHLFARINWYAHLIPLVEKRAAVFAAQFDKNDRPYVEWREQEGRTDAALATFGIAEPATVEIWTDSIAVRFPVKPLSRTAVVPVQGRHRRLAQYAASLQFAERASGGVITRIYLPKSELLKPTKDQYVIAITVDPRVITRSVVDRYLRELYEVQSAWATESVRPLTRWWLAKKLESMERAARISRFLPWQALLLVEPVRLAYRALAALARSKGHSAD